MGRVINVHAAISVRDTVVHSQRSVFLAHMKKPVTAVIKGADSTQMWLHLQATFVPAQGFCVARAEL